jgi:hypothetical protein
MIGIVEGFHPGVQPSTHLVFWVDPQIPLTKATRKIRNLLERGGLCTTGGGTHEKISIEGRRERKGAIVNLMQRNRPQNPT